MSDQYYMRVWPLGCCSDRAHTSINRTGEVEINLHVVLKNKVITTNAVLDADITTSFTLTYLHSSDGQAGKKNEPRFTDKSFHNSFCLLYILRKPCQYSFHENSSNKLHSFKYSLKQQAKQSIVFVGKHFEVWRFSKTIQACTKSKNNIFEVSAPRRIQHKTTN